MEIRALYLVIAAMCFLGGCASSPPSASHRILESDHPFTKNYKVDAYIRAAAELQSLGREAALERLYTMGNQEEKTGHGPVFILCRMLFTQRAGLEFRGMGIGEFVFFGGTQYSDWPLMPIELVDGVPFLITNGSLLAGLEEPAGKYVHYCETSCDWSSFQFVPKNEQQKIDALQKVIASPKWKRSLSGFERTYLSEQIQ